MLVFHKVKYNYYPRVLLNSVSKNFVTDLTCLLKILKFNHYQHISRYKQKNWNDTHRVFLVGRSNLIKWMILIGSKNPCKLSRYMIWEEFGFCSTNITYDQRINILEGKLNPYSLYEGLVV